HEPAVDEHGYMGVQVRDLEVCQVLRPQVRHVRAGRDLVVVSERACDVRVLPRLGLRRREAQRLELRERLLAQALQPGVQSVERAPDVGLERMDEAFLEARFFYRNGHWLGREIRGSRGRVSG